MNQGAVLTTVELNSPEDWARRYKDLARSHLQLNPGLVGDDERRLALQIYLSSSCRIMTESKANDLRGCKTYVANKIAGGVANPIPFGKFVSTFVCSKPFSKRVLASYGLDQSTSLNPSTGETRGMVTLFAEVLSIVPFTEWAVDSINGYEEMRGDQIGMINQAKDIAEEHHINIVIPTVINQVIVGNVPNLINKVVAEYGFHGLVIGICLLSYLILRE